MAKVRVEDLTKRFRDVVAVDHVSFEVGEGEFMCMLGPSGCGKTTTLRCIAGLETLDEGNIYIGDTLVNDLPPKDRDIAMIFQFYAMYPDMNVFNQIAFPLQMRKTPKHEVEKRVKEVAAMLGIDHLLKEPIARLTVEQRQKVEVGRAIVREPRVYLFDEPLTNLDARIRAYMRAELKRLQEELGTTTIYVTHDQLEAMVLADRIAVMNYGKIMQYDKPDVLYDHPKNLFVASFIGSPSMNFVDSTLVEKDGKSFLDAGEFLYDVSELKDPIKEQFTSSELILGVRPEHISISKERVDKDMIEAEVDIIEPVGDRMIINLKIGQHLLKANVRRLELAVGEKVWIAFDKPNLHVIDKKTEKTII